jgi:hypothetical protein
MSLNMSKTFDAGIEQEHFRLEEAEYFSPELKIQALKDEIAILKMGDKIKNKGRISKLEELLVLERKSLVRSHFELLGGHLLHDDPADDFAF